MTIFGSWPIKPLFVLFYNYRMFLRSYLAAGRLDLCLLTLMTPLIDGGATSIMGNMYVQNIYVIFLNIMYNDLCVVLRKQNMN